MRVIGFNFTRLSTERFKEFINSSKNINISFKNINKEEVELLKNLDSIKISFEYTLTHTESENQTNEEKKPQTEKQLELNKENKTQDLAKITIEGNIVLALPEVDSKEILKQWKKQEISPNFQVPLYNLIFKKCTPALVYLADSINLPSPVPIQKIQPKQD